MLDQIQQWYIEAVSLHGDDWPKIEGYVARKLAALEGAERRHLSEAFERLFACESGMPN